MQLINAPGRFSTSPEAVAHDMDHWTGTGNVSVVFTTEVAAKARAKALVEAGWTVSHRDGAGKGECAILTKDGVRKVVAFHLVKLNDGGGKGRLAEPMYAPVVIVEGNNSSRRTLLTDCHLRAHLEGLWTRLPLKDRTRVKRLLRSGKPAIRNWISDVQTWRAGVHHYAAQYHVDDIIVAADWNINGHAIWVQKLMGELWPGLNMIVPKAPDFAHRSIGWILTSFDDASPNQASDVLQAQASDHDACHYTLRHLNTHPAHRDHPALTPPDPFERCTYNGALMDQKTKTAIQLAEKMLGYALTILQGCYNHSSVKASGTTHNGGQVIDFAPFDFANKVKVFREMGWFIWHRLPIPGVWGEHIHGGIRNGGTLDPMAKAQQVDFDHYPTGKRDGLAGHNIDPDQFPAKPHAFDYVAAWHEING